MTASKLRVLPHAIGLRLNEGFRAGVTPIEVDDLVEDFARDVRTDHLREVLNEAMRRFDYDGRDAQEAQRRRADADVWASPRVHAALRLTRREAANRGLWRYVGVVVAPDFVRWRFFPREASKVTPGVRFTGPDEKHAVGRLWWGAELMRNGTDYSPVTTGFEVQNIADNLLRWDMGHNRAVTQGVIQYLLTYDKGGLVSSADAVVVGKALNRAATTIFLDALAPTSTPDAAAYDRWCKADINEQAWFSDDLPEGPDDGEVDPASVEAVVDLLRELAPPIVAEDDKAA